MPLDKILLFRLVIAFLLETTDSVPNSTHIFLLEKFCFIDILANGNILLIENAVSGLYLQRHPNDIKLFNVSLPSLPEQAFKNDNITYGKVYTGEILLILLPKVSTPIMTNPFKRQILTRLP